MLKKGRSTFGRMAILRSECERLRHERDDRHRAGVRSGKAARVLLDEAELMGLGYSFDINTTQKVTTTGDRQDVDVIHKMHTTAREAPPR